MHILYNITSINLILICLHQYPLCFARTCFRGITLLFYCSNALDEWSRVGKRDSVKQHIPSRTSDHVHSKNWPVYTLRLNCWIWRCWFWDIYLMRKPIHKRSSVASMSRGQIIGNLVSCGDLPASQTPPHIPRRSLSGVVTNCQIVTISLAQIATTCSHVNRY